MVGKWELSLGGVARSGVFVPPPSSPPHPTLCTPSAAMNRLKGTDFVSRTASPEGTEELLRELLVS